MEQSLVTEFATLLANALEQRYTVTRVLSSYDPLRSPEAEFHAHVDCRLVRIAVIYSRGDYYTMVSTACKGGRPFDGLPYSKVFDLVDPNCFEKMANLVHRKIQE